VIALGLWLGEFCLEASGAFFAFRRRLTILAAYLAFSAASDAILFLIRNQHPAYGYGLWLQEAGQYLMLCALATQLVSRMLEDYRRISGYASGLCVLLGVIVGLFFHAGETWEAKFLDAEISASLFLAAMILVGWIGKKKRMEEPWNWITVSLVGLLAGNAICAILSAKWPSVEHLYPVPQITSLLLWNYAGISRKRKEVRIPLGRKPVASAVMARTSSKRVM
jgi:hypothetical protein